MDQNLLRHEMRKKKISVRALCKKLKISPSAFYRKCDGKSDFKQSEIQAIVDLLQLESPMAIFFAKEVS